MAAGSAAFDWDRFDAWLAAERPRRHDVPGFEHAMFFAWWAAGCPAADEVVPALMPEVAPSPRPARARSAPAPRPPFPRPAGPAATGHPQLF